VSKQGEKILIVSKDDENYDLELHNSTDGIQWAEIPSENIQRLENQGLVFEYHESIANMKNYYRLWEPIKNEIIEFLILDCSSDQNPLVVYPIPANDEITLSGTEGIEKIQIWDLKGLSWRTITNKNQSNSIKINVKNWPEGIYMVRGITETGKTFNTKISLVK